jgi:hypothetical protein
MPPLGVASTPPAAGSRPEHPNRERSGLTPVRFPKGIRQRDVFGRGRLRGGRSGGVGSAAAFDSPLGEAKLRGIASRRSRRPRLSGIRLGFDGVPVFARSRPGGDAARWSSRLPALARYCCIAGCLCELSVVSQDWLEDRRLQRAGAASRIRPAGFAYKSRLPIKSDDCPNTGVAWRDIVPPAALWPRRRPCCRRAVLLLSIGGCNARWWPRRQDRIQAADSGARALW